MEVTYEEFINNILVTRGRFKCGDEYHEKHHIVHRCMSGTYAEAHECDCCGEWITGDYIKTKDGKRYCENCYTTMELGDED